MNTSAIRVLFLCTGNSCRSQMAEGLARAIGEVESFSAGSDPQPVHPLAVRVLSEIEIDITGQTSKPLDRRSISSRELGLASALRVRCSCHCSSGSRRTHLPQRLPSR